MDVNVIPKNLFEQNEDDLKTRITQDFTFAEEGVSEKCGNWEKNYEKYLGLPKARTQIETGAKLAGLSFPKIGGIIDWLTARTVETIFNFRPITNFTAINSVDSEKAEIVEELIDIQDFNVPQMRRKHSDIVKGSCIYNTGIFKVFWDFELNQPVYDTISRYNFFEDPHARYIHEAAYAFHRYYMTQDELWNYRMRKDSDEGMFEENALKELFRSAQKASVEDSGAQREKEAEGEGTPVAPEHAGRYEIWEYWTKGGLVTVGLGSSKSSEGGMVILKRAPDIYDHGKLPFLCSIYNAKPERFDGHGVVDMLKPLSDEYDTIRRQLLDYKNFVINPRTYGPRGMFTTSDKIAFKNSAPGEHVDCDPEFAGKIGVIPVASLPHDVLIQLGMLDEDMHNRAGAQKPLMGQALPRKELATTIVNLLQRGDVLHAFNFGNFSEDILVPKAKMFLELNKQFLKGKIQSGKGTLDGKTKNNPVEILQQEFRVKVNVSAISGSNEMQRAQLLQFLQPFLQNIELASIVGLDLKKSIRVLGNTFDQIKNPEDLFVAESEQDQQIPGLAPGMPPDMSGMGGQMGMSLPGSQIAKSGMFRGQKNVSPNLSGLA